MDTVRTAFLVAHFAGLGVLALSLLWTAFAPTGRKAARWVLIGAGLMAITGLTLLAARTSLDLPVNGVKMAVKTLVLTTIVICAIQVRSIAARPQDEARGQFAALCAAIGALVIGNVAIAFGWN